MGSFPCSSLNAILRHVLELNPVFLLQELLRQADKHGNLPVQMRESVESQNAMLRRRQSLPQVTFLFNFFNIDRISSIENYLQSVQEGKLPKNPTILYRLQEIFNLLPDLHSPEARKALTVANNDQSMMIFAGSVLRSVVALHELINNKIDDQTALISTSS